MYVEKNPQKVKSANWRTMLIFFIHFDGNRKNPPLTGALPEEFFCLKGLDSTDEISLLVCAIYLLPGHSKKKAPKRQRYFLMLFCENFGVVVMAFWRGSRCMFCFSFWANEVCQVQYADEKIKFHVRFLQLFGVYGGVIFEARDRWPSEKKGPKLPRLEDKGVSISGVLPIVWIYTTTKDSSGK